MMTGCIKVDSKFVICTGTISDSRWVAWRGTFIIAPFYCAYHHFFQAEIQMPSLLLVLRMDLCK